jgi:hypothetical protein
MSFVRVKVRKHHPQPKYHTNDKIFWCPACKQRHKVDKRWKLSGSLRKPTIEPDVIGEYPISGELLQVQTVRCHVQVKDGMLHYAEDCGHSLAGKSIPMVEIEKAENEAAIQSKKQSESIVGPYGMGVMRKQGLTSKVDLRGE